MFDFGKLLLRELGCCNPCTAKMPKTRHTVRYARLLQALRAARQEASMTQVQVAKHFHTYASFISKVESGERRLDVVELADFCRLYGLKLTALLKTAGID